MNIPDEAVEAAAKAVDDRDKRTLAPNEEWAEVLAVAALEAAAPLLMAEAWSEGRATGRTDPYCLDPNPYRSRA